MAIDNVNKRASAGVQGLDFYTIWPEPDGTIDSTDQVQTAALFASPVSAPVVPEFLGANYDNYTEVHTEYFPPGGKKKTRQI